MPKWTFKEDFSEDGGREESTCVSRVVEDGDIHDQLWFMVRCLEVASGTPVRQLTVSFEGGETYSTEL